MRKTLRAATDGSIPGLGVVGHHGIVDQGCTPAVFEAIYSFEGTPAAVVGSDLWVASATIEVKHDSGDRTGQWTPFDRMIPAEIGRQILVLGPTEREHSDELAQHGLADEIVCALRGELGARFRSSGDLLFCYSTLTEVQQALATITRLIVRRSQRLWLPRDLVSYGWWLSRSAVQDAEVLLACGMLKCGGELAWRDVAADHFGGLKEWEQRIDAAFRPARVPARARDHLRQMSMPA